MKRFVLFGILLSTAALPASAGDRIALRISPTVAFAPANLVVRTTIAADARNRAIEIVAESPDFYRSSEMQLDGENAPRTSTFEFRSLPPGDYEVKATLLGSDGAVLFTVRQPMNVIATGSH
jgi:hypothetical protein